LPGAFVVEIAIRSFAPIRSIDRGRGDAGSVHDRDAPFRDIGLAFASSQLPMKAGTEQNRGDDQPEQKGFCLEPIRCNRVWRSGNQDSAPPPYSAIARQSGNKYVVQGRLRNRKASHSLVRRPISFSQRLLRIGAPRHA
jgi:hypothetical protein